MRSALSDNTVINDRYVVNKSINFKSINQMAYLCVDQSTGQLVLVKEFFPVYANRTEGGSLEYSRLSDDGKEKFIASNKHAQTYGKLPTIAAVVDIFEANNTVYAVCEYCPGKTISELVANGNAFSKTTVQNTVIMLLKTNMTLAKFGLCNRNFHPDNVVVTDDGYIKLRDFCPERLDVYEGEATKSIAALGFFMMTGEDTEMATRARKHAATPREQALIDYMMYVIEEPSVVTAKEFYNAALLRFDEHAIPKQNKLETETDRKIFGFFAKKRIIIPIAIVSFFVLLLAAGAMYKVTTDVKKNVEIDFKSITYDIADNKNDPIELSKGKFDKIGGKWYEGSLVENREYIIYDASFDEKITFSFDAGNYKDMTYLWEYGEKKTENKKKISIIPSDAKGEIKLTLKKGTWGLKKEIYVIKLTSIKTIEVYTYKEKDGKPEERAKLEDFDFITVHEGEKTIELPSDAAYVSFRTTAVDEKHRISVSVKSDGKKAEEIEINEDKGYKLTDKTANVTFKVYLKGKDKQCVETRKYYFELGKIVVPDVSGKSSADAKELLRNAGLVYIEGSTEYDETVPEGCVIKTTPPKGESVKRGTEVVCTLSAVPESNEGEEQKKKNQAAADKVIAAIKAIGDVSYTSDCKKNIENAESAYNALTPAQKVLVSNYATFTNAKNRYDELKKADEKKKAEEQKKADEKKKADQEKAEREAKEKAEKEKKQADQRAADKVIAAINNIGAVSYNNTCKTKIDNAESAYNALTSDQKALVSNYSTLTAAKATYAQKEEDSKNVVVPEMIGSKVGTNYGNASRQIRKMYPELGGVSVQFHTKTDSSYSDGEICDVNPSPGSVITKTGTIDIYISKKN